MESLLWALDLVAVVLLCRWAVAQDKAAASKPAGKRLG
jgi:hypothetical protein